MSKNVSLLVEMPSTLGHIVAKRKRLLRDGGSTGVSILLKENDTSWIKSSVTGRVEWDAAHETAARIKKEFGKDVYVEPEGQAGRFQERMMPESMMAENQDGLNPLTGAGPGFDNPLLRQMQNLNQGFGANRGSGMFPSMPGMPSMPGSGRNNPFDMAKAMDPMAGLMPHIPSINDFIPNMGQNVEGQEGHSGKAKLSFEPIREASGFLELPEATQKMFEVEAAQAMATGINVGIAITDSESALMALALQPTISKALKKFLEKALETPEKLVVAV